MDSDIPTVEVRATAPGPFMRLQIEISNKVAEMELSEEDANKLAGALYGRVRKWIDHVYLAECNNSRTLPHRTR